MSQVLSFGNVILANSGKRGILKPMSDGSGYYRMNAGGFNIPNRGGIAYRFNEYLKECMSPESDLNRRVTEGQVYCELGHPPQYFMERINGQIVRTQITEVFQWINRLRTIEMGNVCAHIRKIHWILTGGDRDPVHNEIELIPFGTGGMKEWMTDSLANPDINTAVSLRSVTKPQRMGDMVREVEYLSTYDVVVEQGVLRACKHLTAGLESYIQEAEGAAMVEVSTTIDEVIFACEKNMKDPILLARFEGTESFKHVNEMIDQLKRLQVKKPIQLIQSNSMSVFG